MNEKAVAERMRTARRLATDDDGRGMTQEDAARALGVTVRTYARWERGETAGFLRELERIADVFGTSTEALLGVDESGDGSRLAGVETQLAALVAEVRELRDLLMDPTRLRAEADALIREEGGTKRPSSRQRKRR